MAVPARGVVTVRGAAGNSVKGQLVARFLSEELGLDLLASEPAR
jgi:hypothetical protein